MPHEIYPSFGNLGYWHTVEGAPLGSPVTRANILAALYAKERQLPAAKAKIPPMVMKGLALELCYHFSSSGENMPPSILCLLSMLLGLPDDFLSDPSDIFSGKARSGAPSVHPQTRNIAMWLDFERALTGAKPYSDRALATRVQALLKTNTPPSRASINKWRAEEDYRDFVDSVGQTPLSES